MKPELEKAYRAEANRLIFGGGGDIAYGNITRLDLDCRSGKATGKAVLFDGQEIEFECSDDDTAYEFVKQLVTWRKENGLLDRVIDMHVCIGATDKKALPPPESA